MTDERSVSVVVPATTANLGCAFDCAGIALGLYLRASATISGSANFEITYSGENADRIPRDSSNLIVRAMQRAAARSRMPLLGAHITVQNESPLGVGLGSSGAAIVAGTVLGAELCGLELDAGEALRLALELEGHPDNIAAAVHGGMVVAATTSPTTSSPAPITGASSPSASASGPGKSASATPGSATSPSSTPVPEPVEVLVARVDVSPKLDFIAVIPDIPLPTEKARSVLPANYARADVVANLQRTALLTACFFSGRRISPELFRDRLHQPYRGPLVPGLTQCLDFRHPGLAGIFLSGAGSAVMAIAEHSAARIADALVAEFRRHGVAAKALLLKADNQGTQVTTGTGARALGPAVAMPTPRA
jgi:homoserine kinase